MEITRLHQVAQRAEDLERASAWYRDVLGARPIATFDPPGIAFVEVAGLRLLLEGAATPATLYFEVADIEAAHRELHERGVTFEGEPHLIHKDADGQFGPAGSEEWMAFLRDSEGNLVALVERRNA